ncbi:malto-oligosyltrehalose trehalohydrolase [Gemmatimonadetes bacterium T265]|nr:malto-oligosyltrehalose trehalohydrolase [Gemmatimonadetes bacterium T265]
MTERTTVRRLPVGAEPSPAGTHFRVWAPERQRVDVVLEHDTRVVPLSREPGDPDGYWSGTAPGVGAGARYRLRLDGGDAYPDPASRQQPDGVHGASVVVDPAAFAWSDAAWRGVTDPARQVLYELHLGTFTPEGTWAGAAARLPALAELGVTTVEVMPVHQFPGRFGWGYDGVQLFAPASQYGTPDDMRRFVDRAHALGLAVVLDVVYNHLGPDGNYLPQFSPYYFNPAHHTDWGAAINFDGPHAGPVRAFYVANARYWVEEFRVDGLRLDATQAIVDDSLVHVLAEAGAAVRAAGEALGGRATWIVNENEPQDAALVAPAADGGRGLDALWNDDWHHSAFVALALRDEAYFTDYRGSAREFVAAAKHGFLYQGQWYRWQRQRRGTPALGLPPSRFVHFLENHDQLANAGVGERLHRLAAPGPLRAMTAALLLGPQLPMLFQGQEWGASAPFQYFADHNAELAPKVQRGRFAELAQFRSLARPEMQAILPVPHDPATFRSCVLDWDERERAWHGAWLRLYRDLIALRRADPVFSTPRTGVGTTAGALDAATLTEHAFVLRYFGAGGDDRLLVINVGRSAHLEVAPEPLLAPPAEARWHMIWSSEHPSYGGLGGVEFDAGDAPRSPEQKPALRWPRENWHLLGGCAVVLAADATR